jgi:hypothetical protein
MTKQINDGKQTAQRLRRAVGRKPLWRDLPNGDLCIDIPGGGRITVCCLYDGDDNEFYGVRVNSVVVAAFVSIVAAAEAGHAMALSMRDAKANDDIEGWFFQYAPRELWAGSNVVPFKPRSKGHAA